MAVPRIVWVLGGLGVLGAGAALLGGGGGDGPDRVHGPPPKKVPAKKTKDQPQSELGEATYYFGSPKLIPVPESAPDLYIPVPDGIDGSIKKIGPFKGYPELWREALGDMRDVASVPWAPGAQVGVEASIYLAGRGDNEPLDPYAVQRWVTCVKQTYDASVSASATLQPQQELDVGPWQPGDAGKPTGDKLVCPYARRQYGFKNVDLLEQPGPSMPRLYMALRAKEKAALLRVWLPPRLGLHRLRVFWRLTF